MFKSWFKKLQKKKPNPYIINEEKTEPASVSVVKRVYTSKGYLTSPYNKNYPATGSLEHKYKPIETITKSASLKEEPKTEIVKQEMVEVKEEISSKLTLSYLKIVQIRFLKVLEVVSDMCCAIRPIAP